MRLPDLKSFLNKMTFCVPGKRAYLFLIFNKFTRSGTLVKPNTHHHQNQHHHRNRHHHHRLNIVITIIINIIVILLLISVSTSGEMFGRCLIQQANIWHRCLTERLLYCTHFVIFTNITTVVSSLSFLLSLHHLIILSLFSCCYPFISFRLHLKKFSVHR